MVTPLIRFSEAKLGYGTEAVFTDLNLEIPNAAFVYLIGKTGSGKSTLLKSIYAELPLLAGEGNVCGYNLNALDRENIHLLRRRMGIIFQDFNLLEDRSVHSNLDFVLKATGWKGRKKRMLRIEEVLTMVNIQDKINRMPHQLSGGEQQRVVIARALLNKPQLIIADEPTGNLDEETAYEVMDLLLDLRKQTKACLLMATHNSLITNKFPGHKIHFESGEITIEEKAVKIPGIVGVG